MNHFTWFKCNFGLCGLIPKPLNLWYLWRKIGGIYESRMSLCCSCSSRGFPATIFELLTSQFSCVRFLKSLYFNILDIRSTWIILQHITSNSRRLLKKVLSDSNGLKQILKFWICDQNPIIICFYLLFERYFESCCGNRWHHNQRLQRTLTSNFAFTNKQ